MNEPVPLRPVEYYLDWIATFVAGIEAGRESNKRAASDMGSPLRGHPLPEWLVKRATWEGVGVLRFKAANPDWREQYSASQQRYHSFDESPDIDAGASNPDRRDTASPF